MVDIDSQTRTDTKGQRFEELHRALETDTHAPLYSQRMENGYRPVCGEGSPDAQIMFIGEAPGAREAVFGRPFIGAAGHLLHDLIKLYKIDRKYIYLTNLIKDRTPEGRNPVESEINHYARYLEEEIDILRPLLVVPMGRLTMSYVLSRFRVPHENARVVDMHGEVMVGQADYGRVKVVPLLHPSAALYDSRCMKTLAHDMRVIHAVATELWLLH